MCDFMNLKYVDMLRSRSSCYLYDFIESGCRGPPILKLPAPLGDFLSRRLEDRLILAEITGGGFLLRFKTFAHMWSGIV
jgi:hypothetical protein